MFDLVFDNYAKYFAFNYDGKLHSGDLLEFCAKALIKIDKKDLNNEQAIQKNYLQQKVAEDLLKQVQNMSYTKEFDCHPILKKYSYLAFDLIFDYWDHKPNRMLLPYLSQIISYEKLKVDKTEYDKLKKIWDESLILEEDFLKKMKIKFQEN